GAFPVSGLIAGPDGNFYGTTPLGDSIVGGNNYGTVFRVTPNGALSALHAFSMTVSPGTTNVLTGFRPVAGLAMGTDGKLYGMTQLGGASGSGTVFRVDTNGANFTSLVSFTGANGAGPVSALTLGKDGNFYGTAPGGGTTGNGTLFKLTPAGVLTV